MEGETQGFRSHFSTNGPQLYYSIYQYCCFFIEMLSLSFQPEVPFPIAQSC